MNKKKTKRLLMKSREGYDDIINRLKSKYEKYDISSMTWEWWQENIEGSKSYLDVTCRECGCHCTNTIIYSIRKGKTFNCNCLRMNWKSKAGYNKMMELLEKAQYANLDKSSMTWEWWEKNIKSSKSYLVVECKTCEFKIQNLSINTIQQKINYRCLCNRQGKTRVRNLYKKKEGYTLIMKKLQEPDYEKYNTNIMTWEWWQKNIENNHSNLRVTCTECGYICNKTSIKNLLDGVIFGCFCNGQGQYNTQLGYERIMKILKKPLYDNYDTSIMTWAWWRENIKGCTSYLNATCKKCGFTSNTTDIRHLLSGRIFRCSCRNKTEAFVQQLWVEYCKDKEYNPNLNCGHIPIDGTKMAFDHKAMCNGNIIIGETDGDRQPSQTMPKWVGHFTEGSTRTNDIKKQKIAFNCNYGLWRLYQPWIWNNKNNLEYLKYILFKMWDKCEAKTLVIMDIHKDLYNFHLNHWKNLGGHIIYVESDEEFTPSVEH